MPVMAVMPKASPKQLKTTPRISPEVGLFVGAAAQIMPVMPKASPKQQVGDLHIAHRGSGANDAGAPVMLKANPKQLKTTLGKLQIVHGDTNLQGCPWGCFELFRHYLGCYFHQPSAGHPSGVPLELF